jgi:hypothetical protein
MKREFLRQLERWWLGANRAGLTGGAVAVKAYLAGAAGATLGNQVGMEVAPISLEQAAFVFLLAFAYEFFGYLGKNPLPELRHEFHELTQKETKETK